MQCIITDKQSCKQRFQPKTSSDTNTRMKAFCHGLYCVRGPITHHGVINKETIAINNDLVNNQASRLFKTFAILFELIIKLRRLSFPNQFKNIIKR